MKKELLSHLLICSAGVALTFSCANNPGGTGDATTATSIADQLALEATLTRARVSFYYSDYFSLMEPNLAGCAGDARIYYDGLAATSSGGVVTPSPLQVNVENGLQTVQPSFIKNVSVDITDSNSNVPSNLAYACSYGNSSTAPPATNCATFDYGADEGVSANLAGSVVLIGGVNNSQSLSPSCAPANGYSTNSCYTQVYAFALDSFPASDATDPANILIPGLTSASQPISSWENLATSSTYSGPTGIAGAATAFDAADGVISLFGGSNVFTTGVNGSTDVQAGLTDTTWLFNTQNQTWSSILSNPQVNIDLNQVTEQDAYTSFTLAKAPSARANFGYIALSGVSLDAMSTTGTVSSANVDTTDHILIVGGQDASGYRSDSHKFNPTYAPEWVDALAETGAPAAIPTSVAVQYLDSYEFQLMSNAYPTPTPDSPPYPDVQMAPIYPPLSSASPSPSPASAFGMAPIYNFTSGTNAGYALVMGGFSPVSTSTGTSTESCYTSGGNETCAMLISDRYQNSETDTANFIDLANIPTAVGSTTEFTPVNWETYQAASGVPWFGGSSLLKGFSYAENDVVFFGGSTCSEYLEVGQTSCSFANPGVYFRMGTNPKASTTVPSNIGFGSSTPPQAAGMATARGQDPSGNPMIVAFGGEIATGSTSTGSVIYYMYNAGTTGSPQPTWTSVTSPIPGPVGVADGAMVYSHVTNKFYLFGGINSTQGTYNADTWALTVVGANCAAAANHNCSFAWTQLDVANGLSCFPSTCPLGRRGHRMVEVNYNNSSPGVEPVNGSTCTSTSPCSFGIFMEGGTNGTSTSSLLGDRWMFDPTANYGTGLWQQMNEMPARSLGATTTVDYYDERTTLSHHLGILFGGETGLENPQSAVAQDGTGATPSNSIVAPTLGDTWIFDYDLSQWNRVNLLGQGYNVAPSGLAGISYTSTEAQYEAYSATNPTASGAHSNYAVLTPPPTTGAVMVTRNVLSPATSGQIPEVYMFGGRTKDGLFQPLNSVYKFCVQSTGENATSPLCDSYDPTANPNSPNPLAPGSYGYSGRWILKSPASGADYSAYLGAGTYDSKDDLVILYGGLQGSTLPQAVTNANVSTNFVSQRYVYEYAPPTTLAGTGTWTAADVCNPDLPYPTPRYGHTLNYDSRHQQLVLIGGNSIAGGVPLQATVDNAGSASYSVPEVWSATRSVNGGVPCYTWTEMTTFSNYVDQANQVPPAAGFSFGAGVYIPSNSFNSGYYSTFNSSCSGSGAISSPDSNENGLLAGGAYIDIDRTQLGTYENVLLNLTYVPMAPTNTASNGAPFTTADTAIFKIHLVSTGQSQDALQGVLQPRFLTYTDNPSYPEIVETLDVMAPPSGQIRQDQVLIPLGMNPSIDRIRIERTSGTAILLDATIFRMGPGSGNSTALPGITY